MRQDATERNENSCPPARARQRTIEKCRIPPDAFLSTIEAWRSHSEGLLAETLDNRATLW